MSLFHSLLSAGGAGDEFTNASGQQGILLIGDSTVAYSTDDTAGPTPTAGTVYEFDYATPPGTIVEVGSTDLINTGDGASAGNGSPWPKFGVDYNTLSGKKPVFVDTHKYNSTLYKATASANLNWIYSTSYLKDGLYTAMKTKADAGLVALGLTKYKAIFVYLGTNDLNSADTLADVLAAFTQLITYVQADFPGSPIYIVTPSHLGISSTQTARETDIRGHEINIVSSFTDVRVAYNNGYGFSLGYKTGEHFAQAYNNAQGASLAKYLFDTEADDDVRRITNMFFDPLSASHKAAWRTAILAIKAAGCWTRINYAVGPKASSYNNLTMELTGYTSPYNIAGGWTFESGLVRTNGSTTYQQMFIVPSLHIKKGGLNDQLWLSKLVTNTGGTGVTATLFGTNNIAACTQLANTNARFTIGDSTSTDISASAPHFKDNTWYGIGRSSSTNKDLIMGSAVIGSASVASTSLNANRQSRGCQGIGVSQFINALHGGYCQAQYSGFDISAFESAWDTLEAAL